ncbi:MAG TPA: peptidase S8, partial [Acetivibrio sp.]|nr:peptidase S8 [Acetivibrio sp.]
MEGRSIKDLDLTGEYDTLLKVTFDTRTEWPSKDKLPKEFNPQEIIEIGKDPGLGIRDLHNQGITGQGVNVAIIDQPLLLGHKEYKD